MKKLIALCLLLSSFIAHAQVKIPDKLIGNWINEQTNNWEVGFFEDFAIYQSGFWNYGSIQTTKTTTTIKLKQGKKSATVTITDAIQKAGSLSIAVNNGKAGVFRPHQADFVPHTSKDEQAFKHSGFKQDTVTIIGYYRGLQEYNKRASKDQEKGPFSVSLLDFIQDKHVEFFSDFDSIGRFQIKFPVINTQEIYVDWGRLTHMDVVEPGETLFLYADLTDFIWDSNTNSREGFFNFINKPKRLIFMEPQARLHNELAGYKQSTDHFERSSVSGSSSSDMTFQAAAIANYKSRLEHLEKFLKTYPSLSARFKNYQYTYEKYSLASNLMQHRFSKQNNNPPAFEKGYMDFIHANMDFTDEKLFTLTRDYSTFIKDYLDYYRNLSIVSPDPLTGKPLYGSYIVTDIDALKYLTGKGMFNEREKEIIDSMMLIRQTVFPKIPLLKDSLLIKKLMEPYESIVKRYQRILERPEVKTAMTQTYSMLHRSKRLTSYTHVIDSLFSNRTLRELLIARQLYFALDHDHVSLGEDGVKIAGQRLSHSFLKDYILKVDNYYRTLGNQAISYQASLRKTDHLKEAKDADFIFSQLIAPFKGKVVYLDFWGTWCSPCLQQMPFSNTLKKELAGKDVIFMYLANNSPEEAWKNVIKKMDLTGENVVHYRLPEEQQGMIERKFSVNAFPTYMLIDKNGKLVTTTAPRPQEKQALIEEINKLLN